MNQKKGLNPIQKEKEELSLKTKSKMRKTLKGLVLFVATLLTPTPSFALSEGVQLFHLIPGINRIPLHLSLFFGTGILLLVLASILRKEIVASLNKGDESLAPPERFGFRAVIETIVQLVMSLAEQSIGKEAIRYAPILLAFAILILFSNVIGLIPGFSPPTGNWNTTLALALVAFVYYHITGFQEHGIKYLLQFFGPTTELWKGISILLVLPLLALTLLMFVIETIGHFARILSLSIRLFVNMWSDHSVISVFASLLAVPLLYPIAFSILGLLVCLIQTLVFVLLNIVYITLAVSHEH